MKISYSVSIFVIRNIKDLKFLYMFFILNLKFNFVYCPLQF